MSEIRRDSTGRVAVIGAGPAGLACAHELARRGVRVHVFEASDRVGGMSKSLELWGQLVDLGPHRFLSADRRVLDFFRGHLGDDFHTVERLTRIHFDGTLYDYPLDALDLVRKLSPALLGRAAIDYLAGALRRGRDAVTLEEWLLQRFGRSLYEIFFRDYSEKLWGLPCSRIDADWASERIRQLSLTELALRSIGLRRSRSRTLEGRFLYPTFGAGSLYDRAAAAIEELGGRVQTSCAIQRVECDGNRACGVVTHGGDFHAAEHVVSTMPLTTLVGHLSGVPETVRTAASRLRFRNTLLVYLEVEGTDLLPDNWLYVHDRGVGVGRITNFRNWGAGLHRHRPSSILCLEYWAHTGDRLWTQEDHVTIAQAQHELSELGLLRGAPRFLRARVVRVPRCYPIYEVGYRDHLQTVFDFLGSVCSLSVIGRYGAFEYSNQDHAIHVGLQQADRIVASMVESAAGPGASERSLMSDAAGPRGPVAEREPRPAGARPYLEGEAFPEDLDVRQAPIQRDS